MFTSEQKQALLALARSAIIAHIDHQHLALPSDEAFYPKRGVFVSLHKHGDLRGCIGYIRGYKSIAASIAELAVAAAFNDPRFPSIKRDELTDICIEISVLGELIPMQSGEEPVIGRDGLFITHPYGSGLLLPQVAVEWHWDAVTFLKEVCRKAGLPQAAYLDPKSQLSRFTAAVFSEADTF